MLQTNIINVHLAYASHWDTLDIGCLDEAECKRAATFRFAESRVLYQAAHAFLRQVLSNYAPLPPQAWRFNTNTYGKPYIANPNYQYLQFNLSHTQGLIACVVTNHLSVGIDVELSRTLEDLHPMAEYSFSAAEAQEVLAICDPHQQQQRFFTYWTLKEACLKAWGTGFSVSPQHFTVGQDQQGKWLLIDNKTEHFLEQDLDLASYSFGDYYLGLAWLNKKHNDHTNDQYPVRIFDAYCQRIE